MNTIDQDTIDFAEDFFFKLSAAQLKEKVDDFKEKQKVIFDMINKINNGLIPKKNWDILWRMGLMVDYCFTTTFGKIRPMKEKDLLDHHKVEKSIHHLMMQPDGFVDYAPYMDHVGQPLLTDSIINILNKFYDDKIIEDAVPQRITHILLVMSCLYKKEFE